MPEINGPQATTMIRDFLYFEDIEQPIIAGVTGHSDDKFIKIAVEAGMNIVFQKTPFPHNKLKDLIIKCDI